MLTETEVRSFLAQFDAAREDFKTWPKWMQDVAVQAVAAFPRGSEAAAAKPTEERAWVLAQNFHAVYERLAPSFGYETRPETRGWVADSPNGKLMRAVCAELIRDGWIASAGSADSAVEAVARVIYEQWNHVKGWVPWVDGGNSHKQDDARSLARAALAASLPPSPQRYRWEQDEKDSTSGYMVGPVPDGEWVKWSDVQPSPDGVKETPTPHRCIKPQCPPNCSGCNHAIPGDDVARVLVADLLDAFAVDGHGATFEDGDSVLVDRARQFLDVRTADLMGTINALRHAEDWIGNAPHGDNCYVSNHYAGDPGNRCNCGKESALDAVTAALAGDHMQGDGNA